MKATLNRKDLLKALRIAKPLTRNKYHPVLQCVELTATQNTLIVVATNLDTAVRIPLLASVDIQGRICVPAAELLDIVRASTEADITLFRPQDSWTVKVGPTTLQCVDPDEYPEITPETPEAEAAVSTDKYIDAVKHVGYAASKDIARQQLMGVSITEGALVTSDGKRLAEYRLPVSGSGILPMAAVKAAAAIAKLDAGEIQIGLTATHARLAMPAGVVWTRILEGRMPDYQSLIPDNNPVEVVCKASDLAAAVTAAAAGLDKDNKVVTVTVDAYGLSVSSATTEPIAVQGSVNRRDKPVTVDYNPAYLLDALKPHKTNVVQFSVDSKRASVLSTRVWRYAFMPIWPKEDK